MIIPTKSASMAVYCTLTAFLTSNIVPDALRVCPQSVAKVRFASGFTAQLGNQVQPSQAAEQPTVNWDSTPDSLYTLAIMDLDVLNQKFPIFRNELNWVVMNIAGNDIKSGDEIRAYIPPHPYFGSGLHRYLVVVHKQSTRVTPPARDDCLIHSLAFSWHEFIQLYQLGEPIAANFYLAQWQLFYNDFWFISHGSQLVTQCRDTERAIQSTANQIQNVIENFSNLNYLKNLNHIN